MSTTPAPLYPNYYEPYYQQAGANNVGYQTGNNPMKTAQNQRAYVASQGDQYQLSDEELAQQYQQQQGGTQAFLNPIEQANASGQGGYTADQASQIELTPQQESNIVTGAGISAGAGTASSVGAAERAAAAAGGSPAALATYRARAAQTQGADAGQAETGASVAAQQAGSAGAQAVGNTQIAQENQGQNYLGNLQAQQGSASQNEQGLAQGAYGTETSGTGAATNSQISAAGIPTGLDKAIGVVAGAAQGFGQGAGAASGLADGYPGYMDDGGQDAVVGENGMEAVIENAPKAVVAGASDPVRSNTKFMDLGTPGNGDYGGETNNPVDPATIGSPASPSPTASAKSGMRSWLQSYLANAGNSPQAPAPGQPGWNKTTPYSQLGSAIGGIVKPFIQKGMNGSGSAPIGSPSSGGVDTALLSSPNGPGTADVPAGAGGSVGDAADYLGQGASDIAAAPADAVGSGLSDAGSGITGLFAADGRPMMANGKVSSFHWPQHTTPAPMTPHMQERAGYQPLGYRAKPMLADGAKPMDAPGEPVEPGNGMQVGNAKVFNKPTMIHLEKADMVVPLGYRAKAKVRPSAALPAMNAAPRRMYGHAA